MNEQDLEKRLRGVVEGPQPNAPRSLHQFLRELPESEIVHHRGPVGLLRAALDRVPELAAPSPYTRRAKMAFGVSMAVVIGIGGAGLLLSLRSQSTVPTSSQSPAQTGPWITPRRSTGTQQPAVHASFALPNLISTGVPYLQNETMARPTAAVVTSGGQYLGVTGGAFGSPGMVHSADGLYWNWSPPSEVDPKASTVTSIATDENGTIVVTGGVQGVDGTTDGRIWTSRDEGVTWSANHDEASLQGVTVQAITYSPGRWVALGWNSSTAPDLQRQIAAWMSADNGRTWNHVATPIKGTSALITSTAAGFVLSGTPLASGAIDEPPIWHSPDGVTWTRSTVTDNTAQLIGPLVSATVTGLSHVFGISTAPDGSGRNLVSSLDGGLTWKTVKPDDSLPYSNEVRCVASLSIHDPSLGYVELLFATISMGSSSSDDHVMMSANGGTTWVRLVDTSVGGPQGNVLLDLGHGWQAGGNKVLSFGEPGSGIGIWLTEFVGAS